MAGSGSRPITGETLLFFNPIFSTLAKTLQMPAVASSFNRFLFLLVLQVPVIPLAFSQLPQFNQEQLEWLGQRVFDNECKQRFECLTSWNQGEDFPSLGIGHFIWFRTGQNERFEETFPALLEYYRKFNYALPQWLNALEPPDSPWFTREQFLAETNTAKMQELRQFLASTTELQVAFIVNRLSESAASLFGQLRAEQRQAVAASFYKIADSSPPYGLYALIDYAHFKGTGTVSSERYQEQGWGLLQVLLELKLQDKDSNLTGFVAAATTVLERRVANAPPERGEQRWIAGWKNRLQSYLPDR